MQWLQHLQSSNAIASQVIFLSNDKWFELYKTFFPIRVGEENPKSIAQLSYYLSSIALDELVHGFTRKVLRSPTYQICYKLTKHTNKLPNEDCAVERPLTRQHVKASSATPSPSESFCMPFHLNIICSSQYFKCCFLIICNQTLNQHLFNHKSVSST